MAINYELKKNVSGGATSDKWRRTRGDNNENVAGTVNVADFASLAVDGVVPSGVALQSEDGITYKPLDIGGKAVLAGFLSDNTGIELPAGSTGTRGISVAIRETIVPKYLPVEAHRALDSKYATTGAFVFIKE